MSPNVYSPDSEIPVSTLAIASSDFSSLPNRSWRTCDNRDTAIQSQSWIHLPEPSPNSQRHHPDSVKDVKELCPMRPHST